MTKATLARLAKVHPGLADKIKTTIAILEQEGISVEVVQGLRTWQEQDDLYAKGRTVAGPKVTNARGGRSYHNYGMAVDMVPGINGKATWEPDWNELEWVVESQGRVQRMKRSWSRMIEVAKANGLFSGSDFPSFKDYPHFQLTGNLPYNAPTFEAQKVLVTKGLAAVWTLAGILEPVAEG